MNYVQLLHDTSYNEDLTDSPSPSKLCRWFKKADKLVADSVGLPATVVTGAGLFFYRFAQDGYAKDLGLVKCIAQHLAESDLKCRWFIGIDGFLNDLGQPQEFIIQVNGTKSSASSKRYPVEFQKDYIEGAFDRKRSVVFQKAAMLVCHDIQSFGSRPAAKRAPGGDKDATAKFLLAEIKRAQLAANVIHKFNDPLSPRSFISAQRNLFAVMQKTTKKPVVISSFGFETGVRNRSGKSFTRKHAIETAAKLVQGAESKVLIYGKNGKLEWA